MDWTTLAAWGFPLVFSAIAIILSVRIAMIAADERIKAVEERHKAGLDLQRAQEERVRATEVHKQAGEDMESAAEFASRATLVWKQINSLQEQQSNTLVVNADGTPCNFAVVMLHQYNLDGTVVGRVAGSLKPVPDIQTATQRGPEIND